MYRLGGSSGRLEMQFEGEAGVDDGQRSSARVVMDGGGVVSVMA